MCEEPLSSTRWTSSSAGTLASNASRKAMKLTAVLRSRSVAVKLPPPWTSRAASKIAVPWRTYSCSWRGRRPGPHGGGGGGGGTAGVARGHAGLLGHRQHQRVGRRDQVQPADIGGPLPEARVVGAGDPAAHPVG